MGQQKLAHHKLTPCRLQHSMQNALQDKCCTCRGRMMGLRWCSWRSIWKRGMGRSLWECTLCTTAAAICSMWGTAATSSLQSRQALVPLQRLLSCPAHAHGAAAESADLRKSSWSGVTCSVSCSATCSYSSRDWHSRCSADCLSITCTYSPPLTWAIQMLAAIC